MNTLTLMGIQVFFISIPIIICLLVQWYYTKPNENYIRGIPSGVCAVLYSSAVLYYFLFALYAPKIMNYYFPIHKETKMVCENKTTYWREGIKY